MDPPADLDKFPNIVRRALLVQSIDNDPEGACTIIAPLGQDRGRTAVASFIMLDLAGLAFRYQVRGDMTGFVELPSLLARLDLENNVREIPLDTATATFTYAAAVGGGVRPAHQPLIDAHRPHIFWASWLTVVTAVRWASDISFTMPVRLIDWMFDEFAGHGER